MAHFVAVTAQARAGRTRALHAQNCLPEMERLERRPQIFLAVVDGESDGDGRGSFHDVDDSMRSTHPAYSLRLVSERGGGGRETVVLQREFFDEKEGTVIAATSYGLALESWPLCDQSM